MLFCLVGNNREGVPLYKYNDKIANLGHDVFV